MPKNWDKVIIRDLSLEMSAGIYEHERENTQPVLVNVILDVSSNAEASLEDISEVVSYENIVREIEKLAGQCHYELLERFAEDIAQMCLNADDKVLKAEIRVEKTNIIDNTAAVGVHILRSC